MILRSALLQLLGVPLGGDLAIPEILHPVSEFQYPLSTADRPTAPNLIGLMTSMGTDAHRLQPPLTATDTTLVCTLDKGVYNIKVQSKMVADFNSAITSIGDCGVFLEIPGGVGYAALTEFWTRIGAQVFTFDGNFTLTQAGWKIKMFTGATGAAQNSSHTATVYVRQLI